MSTRGATFHVSLSPTHALARSNETAHQCYSDDQNQHLATVSVTIVIRATTRR